MIFIYFIFYSIRTYDRAGVNASLLSRLNGISWHNRQAYAATWKTMVDSPS